MRKSDVKKQQRRRLDPIKIGRQIFDGVYVVVAAQPKPGAAWARELYEMFAPAREEAGRYSAAEVDDDSDVAVAAVRGRHA
jgi:hypothetical protein